MIKAKIIVEIQADNLAEAEVEVSVKENLNLNQRVTKFLLVEANLNLPIQMIEINLIITSKRKNRKPITNDENKELVIIFFSTLFI